ncbi:MAG: FAD-dependent oxidoreductase [Fermentimonas sp.]|nr:FAD-dependent oxidoreductase [Fermentimonas sp.]MDD4696345.1 FAD-dependent oxidoreductase [Fermentimonas sp.]
MKLGKHIIQALLFSCWFLFCSTSYATNLLVEAESFENKGGWIVDQQFMDQMGSPYLNAHGIGVPVKDASTTVTFPETGMYHVYVRTFNWTSPWQKGEGPGKFKLKIAGKMLPVILGEKGEEWEWQYAGSVHVKNKETVIALHDLTGFNARCDAIYFTTEKGGTLPSGKDELASFRKELSNLPEDPSEIESFDLVVVGGGIAGMCAAATASRLGSKVALINDRPVLGGNNSSEIRVHLGGTIELEPNKGLGRMIREFGHSKNGNAQPGENYEDEKKSEFIANEENVTLFSNYRAIAVDMEDDKIASVIIKHIENGKEIRLKAPLFSDCTGDGTIGYLAGADYRMGRESRSEFGEGLAPEMADDMTMGSSVQWYSKDTGKKTRFPQFKYGITFNEDNCEKVTMGEWKWETGMNLDQINDFERIRDYGLLVIYSNWSFLKNELKDNVKYRSLSLDWVACIAGKRESRRLLGDYILKQDDIDKNVFHEDASFTTSWSIDLHFPDPVNSEKFPGAEFKAVTNHIQIYPYAVPYRCLYSRNIDNLFMAGRNISVTHVALGTVRVMRTTGMMGEVVGMAASLCKKHDATPREIYQQHLEELKELMQEGAGKKGGIPDNQRFNEQKFLKIPRALKD